MQKKPHHYQKGGNGNLVYSLHKFWHYLLDNKLISYVDQMALMYLI
jgi:hypothetical protein